MKKTFVNETHVEGIIYEHKLQLKVTGETSKNPGTPYISGDLMIATDDAHMNVVTVHFTYVTETTSTGKTNTSYQILKKIAEGDIGNVIDDGPVNAGYVRIDSAIALNEWYGGTDNELISVRRNEGGFVHTTTANDLTDEAHRATWAADMVITGVFAKEADEEHNIPAKAVVKGAIFNFRKALLPVEFSVIDPAGQAYFLGLDASQTNPVFTKVFGQQISQTITKEIRQESAFGDAEVRQVKSTRKDFVITGANPEPYEFDAEDTILASELSEAMAARQVYLAEVKQRQDEYQSRKNIPTATSITTAKAPAAGNFNF